MKRIFSLVLLASFAAALTTASAQKKIFVWQNGGEVSIKSTADVDSVTFSAEKTLSIRTLEATSASANTIWASVDLSLGQGVKSLPEKSEVGVCVSSKHTIPTYSDNRKYLGDSIYTYAFSLHELEPGTTYYYRAYVKLGTDVFYGEVKSAKTKSGTSSTSDIIINGHKFVDLGLPSGLLWAKSNVGAIASSDDGDYFAWGETIPKLYYYWSTYKWGDAWGSYSKYNSTDGKTILDSEDDAATVNWGAPCRMPSPSDFEELQDNCEWSWKDNYQGVKGCLVTGPNGNSIFLPASGYRDYDFLDKCGRYEALAYYWASSHANLYFFTNDKNLTKGRGNANRYSGFSIRPVATK